MIDVLILHFISHTENQLLTIWLGLLWLLVFNTTFNNISAISWQSVLLVEETGVPRENHRPVASYCQTLSHNVVSSTHPHERVRTHNFSGDRQWLHPATTWSRPQRPIKNMILLAKYNTHTAFNPFFSWIFFSSTPSFNSCKKY
jgi:hypothetical protein